MLWTPEGCHVYSDHFVVLLVQDGIWILFGVPFVLAAIYAAPQAVAFRIQRICAPAKLAGGKETALTMLLVCYFLHDTGT